MIARIDINGICFNTIIRHFCNGVARGEVPIVDDHLIGISVIDAIRALVVIRPLLPAGKAFELADALFSVIFAALGLEVRLRIRPGKFSRNDILLRDHVSVEILCLVRIHHVPDIDFAECIDITGRIVIAHIVSRHIHRVLF